MVVIWRAFIERNIFRTDNPQTLSRRLILTFHRRIDLVGVSTIFNLLFVQTKRVTSNVAFPFKADDFSCRAVVVTVATVFRVAVKPGRAGLTVFIFGVIETKAASGLSIANSGGKIFVAVALTRRASRVDVGGVSEAADDADVASFAGSVVEAVVANADAADARRVAMTPAVDAAVRS
jgi:hypothetical protein